MLRSEAAPCNLEVCSEGHAVWNSVADSKTGSGFHTAPVVEPCGVYPPCNDAENQEKRQPGMSAGSRSRASPQITLWSMDSLSLRQTHFTFGLKVTTRRRQSALMGKKQLKLCGQQFFSGEGFSSSVHSHKLKMRLQHLTGRAGRNTW